MIAMSAAHVSGLVSLLKSKYSYLDNEDIQNVIKYSSRLASGRRHIDADSAFQILEKPNILTRPTVSGSTWSGNDPQYLALYIPGYDGQTLEVEEYTVTANVTFPKPYLSPPRVWGRSSTTGLMQITSEDPQGVLYDFRDTRVSSVTTTGCVLKTSVYKINVSREESDWYPCAVNQVNFQYSILGELVLDPVTTISAQYNPSPARFVVYWNSGNASTVSFKLERKVGDNGQWGEVATIAPNLTQFEDVNGIAALQGGEHVYYRIRPWSPNQTGVDRSPEVMGCKDPGAPTLNTVTVLHLPPSEGGGLSQSIGVYWSAPAGLVDHYRIRMNYPNHPGMFDDFDSILTTSDTVCSPYWNEPVNLYVTAISACGWGGMASQTVQANVGGADLGCYAGQIPLEDPYSVIPDSTELGRLASPLEFALEQNSPNPFNPTTTIAFRLPEPCHVRLIVNNMLGQEVAVLADDYYGVGQHEVVFDAAALPSGVYLYRIAAGGFIQQRKMLLLK